MRLFAAIDLPEEVRAALAHEQQALARLCRQNREIRWARAEGLHLTLKFLGEVPAERVPGVAGALGELGDFAKFPVEIKGLGFFPDARKPRVLWAGVEASAALGELAGRVDTALERLDFAPAGGPFRPHLTLARFRRPRSEPALEAAAAQAKSLSFGRFEANEFFLFESRLLPSGAEYHKLAQFPAREHSDL